MIRLDALTLKQLRALAAVAETGSLSGAAARLSLTPPAVHSQIRNLETAFARPVLHRGPDAAGFTLTEEGRAVAEAAARIETILAHCADQVTAIAGGHAGKVTLGVVSTAKYFAPRLVRRLNLLCPDIRIALRVGNRGQIVADLARQDIDLAIMGRPPRFPEVTALPLGPHPHGLVAPPDHPLAREAHIAPDRLLAETFIAREEGSGTRILMSRYLDALGEGRMPDLIEMDSNETIKQAVIAGLGIAFLSLHTVTDELRYGRLVQLGAPGLPVVRHWFLVHAADRPPGPAAARLQAAITAMEGDYLPGFLPGQPTSRAGEP